jgi:uncharacterized protein (DUF2147 family)
MIIERELMRSSPVCCLFISMILLLTGAPGQDLKIGAQPSSRTSPVGRWKTVDDATGKVNSVVVIWEENGNLYGKIEKLVDPDPRDPVPRCVLCEGEMKGKPLMGLRILWDLRKDGDQWSGGKILDPDNGKTYKCYITVENGGKKLKVRGFIGFSMLGRTQYWLRDE